MLSKQGIIPREFIDGLASRLRELNPIMPPNRQPTNPCDVKINNHKWRLKNLARWRDIIKINGAKRRARKANIEGFHTVKEWIEKKALYGNRCAYCHKKLKRPTQDHIVPVSKGGTNYIHNIVPACNRCNSSKHAQDIHKWEEFTGLQLPLSMS